MTEWHYSETKGDRQGPVSQAEMARLAPRLAPGTMVWRSGLIEWEPLADHFGDRREGPWTAGQPADVDVVEAVRDGWRRWAQLRGRSNRAHYWFWVLFCMVISSVLGSLDGALGMAQTAPFSLVFGLATFVPSLTLAVRRLHDRGRSGWWLLLMVCLPVIGWIILVIWMIGRGTPQANRYGPRV